MTISDGDFATPPLRLPPVTILVGGQFDGQRELATAICRLDNRADWWSTTEIVSAMTYAMFAPDGHVDGFQKLPEKFPFANGDWSDWYHDLDSFLRQSCGPMVFAEMALRRLEQYQFERTIFLGIRHAAECNHIIERIGRPADVQIINCGPLLQFNHPAIHLPVAPSLVAERIALIRRELGDLI